MERLVKQERMSEQGAVDEEVYGEEALGMEPKERELLCQDWSSFERGPDGIITNNVEDFQKKVMLGAWDGRLLCLLARHPPHCCAARPTLVCCAARPTLVC